MSSKNILQRNRKKKALTLFKANRLREAKGLYENLLKADPRDSDAWLMLGVIGGRQGQYVQAANCFHKAVSLRPDNIQAYLKLAVALRFLRRYDEAVDAFRKVLEREPDQEEAGDGLAYLLFDLGRKDEAIEIFRETLRYHPLKAERHSALGSVLQAQGLHEEAINEYKKALEINPDLFVFSVLGGALLAQGRLDEAVKYCREGVARQPDNASAYSGLLMMLNYLPDMDKGTIYEEHKKWGESLSGAGGEIDVYRNVPVANRRLRIGYVSPDFRTHSVAYFMAPLLARHNKTEYEIFCYSMVPRPDETTLRLKKLADHWRDIYGWDDKHLYNKIISDEIDILVDLAGHSANNSLTVFACKAAPVLVTYLGYPNTTGLSVIDYRLTDAVADPAGESAFYTEKLIRLPDCFLCYEPPFDAPPVGPLPAVEAAYVTFGSFNNLAKVNAGVVALWSRVLEAVPGSRLIFKHSSLNDPATRTRYSGIFASCGIDSKRVDLCGHIDSRAEHLALYSQVDIALDTFPYNGTTTTCEALWMGVPVMCLEGQAHAARVGNSLLSCVGLEEWVADTPEEFVFALAQISGNVQMLAELRARLREMVAASPLCDSSAFTRNIESAYREMWSGWCDSSQAAQG